MKTIEIKHLYIKRCPFCQAHNEHMDFDEYAEGQIAIMCCKCGARGGIGRDYEDAVFKWNTRDKL